MSSVDLSEEENKVDNLPPSRVQTGNIHRLRTIGRLNSQELQKKNSLLISAEKQIDESNDYQKGNTKESLSIKK